MYNERSITYSDLMNGQDLSNDEYIIINKDNDSKRYKIINDSKLLVNCIIKSEDNIEGYILPEECNNLPVCYETGVYSITNTIFLKDFNIDYCENAQEFNNDMYSFINCTFNKNVKILGGNYQNISFSNCECKNEVLIGFVNDIEFVQNNAYSSLLNIQKSIFNKGIEIRNSGFNNYWIKKSKFKEQFYCNDTRILGELEFTNIDLEGDFEFENVTVNDHSKFKDIDLHINSKFIISECLFTSIVELFFNKLDGVLQIYKTSFTEKCYLDYEEISKNYYKNIVQKDDLKSTKWTFFHLCEIYKANGKMEQYLDTYYLHKKFERKDKLRMRKWYNLYLIDFILEKTTKYFTCWKTTVRNSFIAITLFTLLYLIIPNDVLKDGSTNFYGKIYETILNNNFNMQTITKGINKVGEVFYFSTSTFIGKGNEVKGVASIMCVVESIMGLLMISSLIGTLTRRYSL